MLTRDFWRVEICIHKILKASISAGYISLFTNMLPEESFKMICQSVSLAYYEGSNGMYFLVKARVEMCEHLFSI